MDIACAFKGVQCSLKAAVVTIGHCLDNHTHGRSPSLGRMQVDDLHLGIMSSAFYHVHQRNLEINVHHISMTTPVIEEVGAGPR